MMNNKHYFHGAAGMTLVNALVGMGFSAATLFTPEVGPLAWYTCNRSLALLMVAVAVWVLRSRGGVMAVGATLVLVQGFDTVVGFFTGSIGATVGPAVLGILTAGAMALDRTNQGRGV